MTLLIQTPKTIVLGALRHAADRASEHLATLLVRSRSRGRHRAPSRMRVRWQRCKSAFTRYLATARRPSPPGQPPPPVERRGRVLGTRAWTTVHGLPRMAQFRAGPHLDTHYWHGTPTPAVATTAAATTAATAVATTAVAERTADPPPAFDAWPTAEPESWVGSVDARFAGYFIDPAIAEPAVVRPAVEPVAAEYAVVEPAVVESLVWKFRVGDLTEWWDEATARLDGAGKLDVEVGCYAGDRSW